MKKVYFLCSILLLSACSNFADDGDYSDAIKKVEDRSNFVEVQGKAFSTGDIIVGDSQILNSAANITAIFPKKDSKNLELSHVAMSMTFFKTYNFYTSAIYNGKTVALKDYKVSSEVCNDNCTTTQYVTFPVDMETLQQARTTGLVYQIVTPNKSSVIDYKIPAGYVEALFNEANGHISNSTNIAAATTIAPITQASKPQEMVQYWFDEASAEQKQAFSSWAFQNRKQVAGELKGSDKPSQMLDYWYKKATPEQRSDILSWLLKNE
ncbi:hypothetical protein HC723_05360 [Vibrio sp. S11_S32]|uniref:hypothetical protein n=1 Tax=Vibrio sp. S11_S32 TaxID=2720225 RepID=UPI001680C2C1|nr:hypothetical protein [Vibrio sp. S11_S32]MBD1575883.1 hypothetical protein [Vibrio sp. S11_S32]